MTNLKLLADQYIELNVREIQELTADNLKNHLEKKEYYCFVFCRSGTAHAILENREIVLEENDILFIDMQEKFRIEGYDFSAILTGFGGVTATELLAYSPFDKEKRKIRDTDAHLGYYFYKMYHAYHEAESLSIRCLGILYELFYELTKETKPVSKPSSHQEHHIEIAKEFKKTLNLHKNI